MSIVDPRRARTCSSPTKPHGAPPAVLDLPMGAASVRLARRFVEERCIGLGRSRPTMLADSAVLLTSELVTEALVQASGPVQVRVTVSDRSAHVEVQAGDPQAPLRPQLPARRAASGSGLLLLDELADSWGIIPAHNGRITWFTVEQR